MQTKPDHPRERYFLNPPRDVFVNFVTFTTNRCCTIIFRILINRFFVTVSNLHMNVKFQVARKSMGLHN